MGVAFFALRSCVVVRGLSRRAPRRRRARLMRCSVGPQIQQLSVGFIDGWLRSAPFLGCASEATAQDAASRRRRSTAPLSEVVSLWRRLHRSSTCPLVPMCAEPAIDAAAKAGRVAEVCVFHLVGCIRCDVNLSQQWQSGCSQPLCVQKFLHDATSPCQGFSAVCGPCASMCVSPLVADAACPRTPPRH